MQHIFGYYQWLLRTGAYSMKDFLECDTGTQAKHKYTIVALHTYSPRHQVSVS